MRRAHRTAALAAVLLTTACVPQDLAFRTDKRLTITSPEDREEVTLPLTLQWTVRDLEIASPDGQGGGVSFAVFIDKTPMPPGKSVQWIARNDTSCRESDGCPDEQYLATQDIYVTTDTQLTIEQLALESDDDRRERHRATIVLLDATGERMGESAFEVVFEIDREEQP